MCAPIIAHADTAPILDTCEEIFDLVPLFIELGVVLDQVAAITFWRNAGLNPALFQALSKPVGIITAIRNHVPGVGEAVEHQGCAYEITSIAFGQQQYQGATLAIANGMELGVQPTFRAANTSGKRPFFSRLAAVRWALR